MTDTSDRPIDRKERVHQLPESYNKRTIEERIQDFDEVAHGPDLVITAVATAHKAAESMDAYLRGEHIPMPAQNEKTGG